MDKVLEFVDKKVTLKMIKIPLKHNSKVVIT